MATAMENGRSISESDTDHLLQYFPEELWLLVLDKIEATEVLENVSNASPFFHRLLGPKRVRFLFSRVWDILITKDIESQLDTSFGKQVLLYRQVCPWWRKAIDEFILQQTFHSVLFNVKTEKREVVFDLDMAVEQFQREPAKTPHHIPDFLNHFEPSHGTGPGSKNPFLARIIFLKISPRVEAPPFQQWRQDYNRNVTNLLTKYGHHLHIAHFKVEDIVERLETYTEIREWLMLMPNLKSCCVNYSSITPDPRENARLSQGIRSNPLPHLTHLEHVATKNVPSVFFNHLVSVQRHVTDLEFYVGCRRRHWEYDFNLVRFPNLKCLNIFCDNAHNLIEKLGTAQFGLDFETLKIRVRPQFGCLPRMFEVIGYRLGNRLGYFMLTIILPRGGSHNIQRANAGGESERDGKIWDKIIAKQCYRLKDKFLSAVPRFELKFKLPLRIRRR